MVPSLLGMSPVAPRFLSWVLPVGLVSVLVLAPCSLIWLPFRPVFGTTGMGSPLLLGSSFSALSHLEWAVCSLFSLSLFLWPWLVLCVSLLSGFCPASLWTFCIC